MKADLNRLGASGAFLYLAGAILRGTGAGAAARASDGSGASSLGFFMEKAAAIVKGEVKSVRHVNDKRKQWKIERCITLSIEYKEREGRRFWDLSHAISLSALVFSDETFQQSTMVSLCVSISHVQRRQVTHHLPW